MSHVASWPRGLVASWPSQTALSALIDETFVVACLVAFVSRYEMPFQPAPGRFPRPRATCAQQVLDPFHTRIVPFSAPHTADPRIPVFGCCTVKPPCQKRPCVGQKWKALLIGRGAGLKYPPKHGAEKGSIIDTAPTVPDEPFSLLSQCFRKPTLHPVLLGEELATEYYRQRLRS
jgi:hypothetical protein